MANVLRALNNFDDYSFRRDPNDSHVIRVQSGVKQHTLRDDDWRCNCEFSMSMRLPCRHATAFRKSSKVAGHLIPWNSIDERWSTSVGELKKVRRFSYERLKDPAKMQNSRTKIQRSCAGYTLGGY
ncbi:hypothetical protein PHMEG_00020003 [Phytophthora megakarya]|uniref:SWIM-type domain-containing protein n=1 Tax=Phytophthora megakarya TaxID=4795 RepID=A0A225VQ26_9STRA|nr:hypothetical protein PHMEG_00020003 [Phytophthora megakarya]